MHVLAKSLEAKNKEGALCSPARRYDLAVFHFNDLAI
jgi:hypothetical protein